MTAAHLPSAVQTVLMPNSRPPSWTGFIGMPRGRRYAVVVAVIVFCYLPARQTSSKSELVLEH